MRFPLAAFAAFAAFGVAGFTACSKNSAPEPSSSAGSSASGSSSASAPAGSAAASSGATAGNGSGQSTGLPTAVSLFDAGAVMPYFADAGFSAREQNDFYSVLAGIDAPCSSVPVSIGQCIAEHRDCADCLTAARYVAVAIHEGWPGQYIGAGLAARFDPAQVKDIAIEGSPTRGPANAPITIIEFGSYLCPHCAAEAPKLDALLAAHPKELRLVFKPVWTADNQTSMHATRAAFAAGNQGKFWEMHTLIFANQPKASMSDLDGYAQLLGLDLAKFHADVTSPAITDRMMRDHAAATQLAIDSIPALFINGHAMLPFEGLEQRIGFELASLPKPSTH